MQCFSPVPTLYLSTRIHHFLRIAQGLPVIPRLFLGLLQVNKAAILSSSPDRILDILYETCGALEDHIDGVLRVRIAVVLFQEAYRF